MSDHTKIVLPPQHGRSPGLAERVAWLRRGKRIADALVQVAEQAGETPGLSELLERVCRLTVELMPADRCTIYLWSARRRVYVLAADCGSPPHLAAPEGRHPRRVRFQEELAAEQMMLLCRDHPMSAERFDTLEEAELYSLVVTPLRGRARTIGSMTVGLQRPPCFDEDALETLRGVARHAATLIENVQLHSRLHKAAALRAELGEFAVRLGSRNDPGAIGRLACAEGTALFRVSEGVMLLREGDALVPCGSSDDGATALAGLRLSLSERDRPTVQAFHGQRPVVVNDFAATASDDDRERYPELKCMLAIPLVGRAGPIGCLVYADRQRTHRFSAEVAADGVLLGAIVAAALEHAQTLEDAFRANAVLREREGHFRALVEHGSDVTTIVDAQGTIQYETPAIEQMLGYTPLERVGTRIFDLVHPEDRPRILEHLGEISCEVREGSGLEFRSRHRDGSWRFLGSVASPLPGGSLRGGTVLHSRDVTERKRRERRVAAQHEAARILAESPTLRDAVPRILTAICESLEWDLGAVWTLDPARRCLRCDALWRAPAVSVPEFEALCRRTTFSPGMELPGRVWSGGTPAWIADVGHDSTSPRASVAAREGLRGALGFPIHTHDGVVGVMEFFSRRIGQPDDELLQILGVISCQLGLFIARQEMAEAVRESEARARLVVETAPNAVITIDAAGIVTGWNGAAERLFGWSRDMVVGQSLGTTVIAPQNRAEYERGLARLLAIGEGPGLETLIEITALRRDGHGIPVELVVWPVCARGAHAVGVLVRDITERKRAERLRAGHEQAIELLRARDEALAASRAKVEFLADRTHDIRTLTTLMEPRGGPAEAESQMELDLRRGVESGGVPALLAHVWVSIGGREGAALAHAAHALERSCWAMGAGAIGALRWGIEHLGQASVLAAARETLARAEEELRHVRAVLDARRRPARPRDP